MQTEVKTSDRRVIHIPAGVHRFWLLLPSYPSFVAGPNQQQVLSCSHQFSLPPTDVHSLLDPYGNRYTEAVWISPPPGEIVEQTSAQLMLSLHAAPGRQSPYPLVSSSLHADAAVYLRPSPMVQSNNPGIQQIARRIAGSSDSQSEAGVVNAVMIWVVDHLHYLPDHGQCDALSTLQAGSGECMGYSHLSLAILRALGIPARFVAGMKFQEPYAVMGRDRNYPMSAYNHSGYLYHAWVQVYFPGKGWVEYDPQGDFGFVDTRCVAFAFAPDKAGLPEGRYINTFEALSRPQDFSEDSHASVNLNSDTVSLTEHGLWEQGPLRSGTYMAVAPE